MSLLDPSGRNAIDGGPPTRTDWAFQLLRSEILIGELRPGQRLKIADLVEQYDGLSPTPVREALARLAELGLVRVSPRRGVSVEECSTEELEDIQEQRLWLEERAGRSSISNGDDAWRAEIAAAFEPLERESERAAHVTREGLSVTELAAWERAHRAFHLALFGRCDSPWLLRLINILFENSMRYRFLSMRKDPKSFLHSLDSHRALRDQAVAGDEQGFLTELARHAGLALDED